MTAPFWGTNDGAKAWDTIYISGVAAPGLAKVKGKASQKLDVKRVKGATGAILRYEGYDPAEFTVTIRVWTEPQWQELLALLLRIKPKKGVAPTAFDVSHPALEALEIRSMYVRDVPFPEEGERGIYEVTLGCLEFLPLPKGGGKSKSTKPTNDIRTHDSNRKSLLELAQENPEAFSDFLAPSDNPEASDP